MDPGTSNGHLPGLTGRAPGEGGMDQKEPTGENALRAVIQVPHSKHIPIKISLISQSNLPFLPSQTSKITSAIANEVMVFGMYHSKS